MQGQIIALRQFLGQRHERLPGLPQNIMKQYALVKFPGLIGARRIFVEVCSQVIDRILEDILIDIITCRLSTHQTEEHIRTQGGAALHQLSVVPAPSAFKLLLVL